MNRKELYILAVITFITVIVWVVLGIYHANKATTVTEIQLKEIEPLTPTFDDDIINKLKNRESL